MTIYNVILNPNNSVGGTNSSNYVYNFNWTDFEEGSYELTVNFNAQGSSVNKVIAIVSPDLGVASNVFTTTSLTAQQFNNVIGIVYPTANSTNTDYNVSSTHNPPIYLGSRPFSNQFTIYLYDTTGTLTDIGVDYFIILSFKKI